MSATEEQVMSSEIVHQPHQNMQMFEAKSPEETIERAKAVAAPLAKMIREMDCFTMIRDKPHVQVEGWLLLGSMVRPSIHPHTVWTKRYSMEKDGIDGWEAKVEARTIDGLVVSAAESMCARDEDKWTDSDEYAIRSMAQTRATSKALSQALRFVMMLAGFEATPAEEMTGVKTAVPTSDDPLAKCPACGSPCYDNRPDIEAGKKKESYPKWKCSNKGCTGGKDDKPWVSWDKDPWKKDRPKEDGEAVQVPPRWLGELRAERYGDDEVLRLAKELLVERGSERQITSVIDVYYAPEEFTDLLQARVREQGTQDAEVVEEGAPAPEEAPEADTAPESGAVGEAGGAPQADKDHCSIHDERVEGCINCEWSGSALAQGGPPKDKGGKAK